MAAGTFSLDDISVLLVWTAVSIYALAFITYAVDLARRSDLAVKGREMTVARNATVGGAAEGARGGVAVRAAVDTEAPHQAAPRFLWARIGTSLTALGFVFHLGADVTRGIAAGRVPWSNMYEFALTGTAIIIAVYLATLRRYDLRFLGVFVSGMVVVLLGSTAIWFYTEVLPLQESLKSVWLVIHVFVASLATALFALSFALSVTQLLQSRRERLEAASDDATQLRLKFLRTLPSANALESLAYRFVTVGFIFWTFTLIAGAVWANDAWGRYWAFDTKEVWTFVVWVLYAGYIHARATRGWRGTPSAWLSIVGFVAVMFNFTIVNMFFKGMHSYSGLE